MGREGVPSPTIDDALQMYDGREFRSKGGGRRELVQTRALGVGNVILEHHGAMLPREHVSLVRKVSL